MTVGPDGIIFVGTRSQGNVYAVIDRDGDHAAEEVVTIAQGLNYPNGVAYRDGALYVAQINRVDRYDDIASRLYDPPAPVGVNDEFPGDLAHGWKFIRFGPNGLLYVPIGAPCNVCRSDDQRYATIMKMNPDGTGLGIFARGVRNTVGFDWHPVTGELWFTDNGRDGLGDDVPPDELNRVYDFGLHFGFPYCHGTDIPDPDYGPCMGCNECVPPEMELGPHVAALGMRFYTGDMFPQEYRNRIFIAEHGSWNRTVPIGYRVTLVRLENNKAVSYEVFAEGWLQGTTSWGRPVDIEVLADGSLLVSDDKAGVIYRITYEETKVTEANPPETFELEHPHPNPFNSRTVVGYRLHVDSQVELSVYSVIGRKIAVLADGFRRAGDHDAVWDGKDAHGSPVSSGVYLVRLKAAGRERFVKTVFLQ